MRFPPIAAIAVWPARASYAVKHAQTIDVANGGKWQNNTAFAYLSDLLARACGSHPGTHLLHELLEIIFEETCQF
jgi:hypothetical protein